MIDRANEGGYPFSPLTFGKTVSYWEAKDLQRFNFLILPVMTFLYIPFGHDVLFHLEHWTQREVRPVPSGPERPVQRPVLNRLRDVLGFNSWNRIQIGNRS